MILIGLTGGIGSGKSSVSSLLAQYGAVIIDADAITRELQAPGQPVLQQLVERFGEQILDTDGSLLRPVLASIAFGDQQALADLNAIVHPAVGREMNARMSAADKAPWWQRLLPFLRHHNVVVLDIPLLTENPREGLCGVVVVDVPEEIAVQRLVEFRSMSESDARSRIAKQASRDERRAIADLIIDNSGTLDDLKPQVEHVWEWAKSLRPAKKGAGKSTPKS